MMISAQNEGDYIQDGFYAEFDIPATALHVGKEASWQEIASCARLLIEQQGQLETILPPSSSFRLKR